MQTVFSVISDRCLYSGASFFIHFVCFFFLQYQSHNSFIKSPRCLFIFNTFDWGRGGCAIWERGQCLFNFVSVCLKELEHKVKKLNCKKWGGGGGELIYFPSQHSEAYKREGLTWEEKFNRGVTVVRMMLILHSSCLRQQIILKSFILF